MYAKVEYLNVSKCIRLLYSTRIYLIIYFCFSNYLELIVKSYLLDGYLGGYFEISVLNI